MKSTCGTASPAAHEALIVLQGHLILADVVDPVHPRTLCTLTGSWHPQLISQRSVSWSATQGRVDSTGTSVIVNLDLFTGTSALVATWQGGGFMDGLLSWGPDQSFLAYVTSDVNSVNLHLLSGGGDRVVANLGAVPARGVNPNEDDAFLGFSPDGAYFAFVQTYTGSGVQLQVHKTVDGSVAYSQATGTMAAWGSAGSSLYFRLPGSSVVEVWTASAGVAQAFGQALAWIGPRTDAGDDYVAFTVRDTSGVPHVWVYGHGGRAGGQLPNVRSSPDFLNADTVFLVEEAPCGSKCGIGPSIQPDGKTFTYSIAGQAETASSITAVYGSWPRPGQA